MGVCNQARPTAGNDSKEQLGNQAAETEGR
jgi:hypothetical protein